MPGLAAWKTLDYIGAPTGPSRRADRCRGDGQPLGRTPLPGAEVSQVAPMGGPADDACITPMEPDGGGMR